MDGVLYWSAYCRACKNQSTKRWRETKVPSYLLAGCKSRAKRFGIPFSLDVSDIVIPTHCPVLGIPLFVTKGKRTDNSPTVDRHIPERGYVPDNISIISWRANRLKNDATPTELKALAEYVARFTA